MEEKKRRYIFNSWRAILYTKKGKLIGFDDSWKKYDTFYNDVESEYIEGYRLVRLDKSRPFGPTNFKWLSELDAAALVSTTVLLTYNNETRTLRDWANQYNIPYNGLIMRYHKNKNYSIEEILFGRKRGKSKVITDISELTKSGIRSKASKMCSSYKLKDWKRGVTYDLDMEWFIENILTKECVYCGDILHVGCDRIDNNKGHTKDNVVPCCYTCNCARNNNFSFDEMKLLGETINSIKQRRNNNNN